MILLAVLGALAVVVVSVGLAWYFDRTTIVFAGAVAGSVMIGAAFVHRPADPPRDGVAVMIDTSCDAPLVTPSVASAAMDALRPAVEGSAAGVLALFADNARTSRRIVLDLSAPPPSDIRGDSVAFAAWTTQRRMAAEEAIARLRTTPCRRIGTSIVGAAEAASAILDDAQVGGRRDIVLATNLIEYSPALRIRVTKFGYADVPRAVAVIRRLPEGLRPPLGSNTSVEVLFMPASRKVTLGARIGTTTRPLREETAVALETWARGVFTGLLHAGSFRTVIVRSR